MSRYNIRHDWIHALLTTCISCVIAPYKENLIWISRQPCFFLCTTDSISNPATGNCCRVTAPFFIQRACFGFHISYSLELFIPVNTLFNCRAQSFGGKKKSGPPLKYSNIYIMPHSCCMLFIVYFIVPICPCWIKSVCSVSVFLCVLRVCVYAL